MLSHFVTALAAPATLAIASTPPAATTADQAAPAPIPARMQTRLAAAGQLSLPVIGCGTWLGFDVDTGTPAFQELAGVLDALFAAGGSVIDSSPMYGRAEDNIGHLLRNHPRRADAFVATKVWTRGRAEGIAQMQRSFERLATRPIDLMQVHNLVDWATHLETLSAWKRDGLIRHLGLTHYTASAHDELIEIIRRHPVDSVQINYALDDRGAEQRLLPFARDRDIAVIVNRPFGGGGLLRRLLPQPLPGWAADIHCTSWAQVLLKGLLANPAVTCVIPGTGRARHMADNVRAGFGPLPDAMLQARIARAIA